MIFFRIISILFLGWIIGLAWFINQVESTQSKNLEKSDAIVVLTGSKGRIDAGIELLLENKANYLFVSGVGQKAPLDDLSQYLSSFNPKQIEPLKSSIFVMTGFSLTFGKGRGSLVNCSFT